MMSMRAEAITESTSIYSGTARSGLCCRLINTAAFAGKCDIRDVLELDQQIFVNSLTNFMPVLF
jgi:hypothetical protein